MIILSKILQLYDYSFRQYRLPDFKIVDSSQAGISIVLYTISWPVNEQS